MVGAFFHIMASSPALVHCVPRVANEDEEDEDNEDAAAWQPATSRRSVSFGQVTVFFHEASLDPSKLPR